MRKPPPPGNSDSPLHLLRNRRELLQGGLQPYDAAVEGSEFVINRYRSRDANLRTQLERIIRKAGLTPWPKLFHNLRASRETELAAEYPIQVVCSWIGNSPVIAARHYLSVQESDFDRAVKRTERAAQNPAHSMPETSQNPAQQSFVEDCEDSPLPTEPLTNSGFVRSVASRNYLLRKDLVDVTGLEPVTSSV